MFPSSCCQVLLRNGFTKLAQLQEASHPREWLHQEELDPGELQFVADLRSKWYFKIQAEPKRPLECNAQSSAGMWGRTGNLATFPAVPAAAARRGVHGPRAALRELQCAELTDSGRTAWMEQARLAAVLGSCRLSIESVKSGLRAYVAFVGAPPFTWAWLHAGLSFVHRPLRTGQAVLFPTKGRHPTGLEYAFQVCVLFTILCLHVRRGWRGIAGARALGTTTLAT